MVLTPIAKKLACLLPTGKTPLSSCEPFQKVNPTDGLRRPTRQHKPVKATSRNCQTCGKLWQTGILAARAALEWSLREAAYTLLGEEPLGEGSAGGGAASKLGAVDLHLRIAKQVPS